MKTKNQIRNTAAEAKTREGALGMLVEAMGLGGSNAIEASEARGQSELVNSDVLPADCRDRKPLEAAGVVFGAQVDGDPLFVNATLPTGWKKVATDHAMHSKLVDERGRERASIFYKAAFYDRSAHIGAVYRFSIERDWGNRKAFVFRALDGKRVLRETVTTFEGDPYSGANRVAYEAAERAMTEWLTERLPNWRDAGAYWDLADDVQP